MFRKPKQRTLRGRTDIDNTDEDQPVAPSHPTTVIHENTTASTTTTTIIKTLPKKSDVPKSLLSFGDDEGNHLNKNILVSTLII